MNYYTILLLVVLLSFASLKAQDDSYVGPITQVEKGYITDQLRLKLWPDKQPSINKIIPQKYLEEPAVFLSKTTSREFYRSSRNTLRTINLEHHVIKILNRKGVEENSIFTHEHIDNEYAFDVAAIRVISENGKVRILDMDSVSSGISGQSLQQQKIVIPGLQPGDILDLYYYIELRVLFPQQYSRIFDAVYLLPRTVYPILDYQLNFTLGPSCFINATSNAFPEFTEERIKTDKKTYTKFTVSLNELDAYNNGVPYYYPFRAQPSLKYQVFVGPYLGNSNIRFNIGGSLKLNNTIHPSRLLDYLSYMLEPAKDFRPHYGRFVRYLKQHGIKRNNTSNNDIALHYYKFIRLSSELAELSDGKMPDSRTSSASRTLYVLKKMNIPAQLVLAFDRSKSTLDQAVLTDEFHPLIHLQTPDALFFDLPTYELPPGQVESRFESGSAYSFDPETKRLSVIDMPVSSMKSNSIHYDIKINMLDEPTLLQQVTAYGHSASALRKKVLNRPALLLNEDGSTLDAMSLKTKEKMHLMKRLSHRAEQEDASIEKHRVEMYASSGNAVKDFHLIIKETGLDKPDLPFITEESFSSEGFFETIGDEYLLTLEEILPSPGLRFLYDELRSEPVYFDYPEGREIHLEIKIPEGYVVEQTNSMDVSILNDSGHYKAYSKVEQGIFKIDINYGYTNIYEPVTAVAQVVEIFHAYESMLKGKILFRKP
ncbi:MAG: DUF3857 domain-containing protein [Bacteroidetes bacterium]|nr:DUF3857 domain-containing protein [Bacteroidota bacterium]